MYVLVDLTFTDVTGSNKTVYSRRNTILTVGENEPTIQNCKIFNI